MRAAVIALVDDDDGLRNALSNFLRSAGYQVRQFASASDFLGSADASPDYVITDMHMPGLSGLELQERMSASMPTIPIIIISAFPDSPAVKTAVARGAYRALRKPFDPETLLEFLEELAENRTGDLSRSP